MSERTKKIIVGGISGALTGIIMEFMRGKSYMVGMSAAIKAIFPGILACVICMLIIMIINKIRSAGPSKA